MLKTRFNYVPEKSVIHNESVLRENTRFKCDYNKIRLQRRNRLTFVNFS
jgi:hypothetical protein